MGCDVGTGKFVGTVGVEGKFVVRLTTCEDSESFRVGVTAIAGQC